MIYSNGPVVNSAFISAPLRLTGAGDTSFEHQDDIDVNFPSIFMPDNSKYQDPSISSPPDHDSCYKLISWPSIDGTISSFHDLHIYFYPS